jgi:hypothetical protein
MMSEVLNKNELATIINRAPVMVDHSGLLDALHARYSNTTFKLVAIRDGRSWAPGLIDQNGNRVADDLITWVDSELSAAGNNAQEVWKRHKDAGFVRTEKNGMILYLTIAFGKDPDAFHQIEVMSGAETTVQNFIDTNPMFAPEDRMDLISGPCLVYGPHERQILSKSEYTFVGVTNIRHFLRDLVDVEKNNRLAELPEMKNKVIRVQDIVLGPDGCQKSSEIPFLELCPDWLDRVPPAVRLFRDWLESSAGRGGYRFCDHWFVQHNDYSDKDGKRSMHLCPQWADADGGLDLPKIYPSHEASPYGVVESLSEFDRQAGYPFAWYFYMLHGNRVTSSAGVVVARAIRDGRFNPFPECDTKVLLRWDESKYGF